MSELYQITQSRPLILNITNYVAMNWSANCLLAVGASPLMAHAQEELQDMVSLSQAVVLNIGTLSQTWVESMKRAAALARELGKPSILDPVGIGASSFRRKSVIEILKAGPPTVIRGNASEILSLAGATNSGKGVDSQDLSSNAIAAGQEVSKEWKCVVCISGELDYVIDGDAVLINDSGHPMMAQVTGMGCAATAVTGAFLAVQQETPQAVLQAMRLMGQAGERAALRSRGPGHFQIEFLDELYEFSQKSFSGSVQHASAT